MGMGDSYHHRVKGVVLSWTWKLNSIILYCIVSPFLPFSSSLVQAASVSSENGYAVCLPEVSGACPKIISRTDWNARPSKSIEYLSNQPVPYSFIHHSAGKECFDQSSCAEVVRGYQNFHMDTRGWDDIGYSFVIGGDGSVFEGRGWDRVGAHTLHYNYVGLGFCLAGNFMTHPATNIQMDTAKALIDCGVSLGKISYNYTLRGHRDMVPTTDCPGDVLYAEIKKWEHY